MGAAHVPASLPSPPLAILERKPTDEACSPRQAPPGTAARTCVAWSLTAGAALRRRDASAKPQVPRPVSRAGAWIRLGCGLAPPCPGGGGVWGSPRGGRPGSARRAELGRGGPELPEK